MKWSCGMHYGHIYSLKITPVVQFQLSALSIYYL